MSFHHDLPEENEVNVKLRFFLARHVSFEVAPFLARNVSEGKWNVSLVPR